MSNPFDIFDIAWYIYKFIPYNKKNDIKYVNKYLYEIWNKQTKNVIKIQRCIRKNNLLDYLEYYPVKTFRDYMSIMHNNNVNNLRENNLLYRYYILKYPMESLLSYPENILNKSIKNLERKNKIENWIKNNLNTDKNKRTRYDILIFFKINNITAQEIFWTGW